MSKKALSYLETGQKSLSDVLAKLKDLAAINKRVIVHLDEELRPYCQVGNLTKLRLTLVVANGSIATKIRFQSMDLLRRFKRDPLLETVQEIICKVRPANASKPIAPSNPHTKPVERLSADTSRFISETAETLSDPKLREVMERIAKHLKK